MRKLGYIIDSQESSVAKKDRAFVRATDGGSIILANSYSLRKYVRSISDQGALGSCVSNAGYRAIHMTHLRDGYTDAKEGARLWGYYIARAYQGLQLEDSGAQIRNFFRGSSTYGFLEEDQYSYGYDIAAFAKKPRITDFRKAFDQKDKGDVEYRRILWDDNFIENICLSLQNECPVVFGTDVSYEFCDYTQGSKIWEPHTSSQSAGGHAMCLVSFNERAQNTFTAVGSWGIGAHDFGYHHFSFDYARTLFRDVWSVVKAPRYSKTK